MGTRQLFEEWRNRRANKSDSGLAWFLANEFCKRFYRSHGIAPRVINKDGLGYYGIALSPLTCPRRHITQDDIGRMTMAGDVENWRPGSHGDHRLGTIDMVRRGVPTSEVVRKAVEFIRLPQIPNSTHYTCRHHRWGRSYEMLFEVMTQMVLQDSSQSLNIANGHGLARILMKQDPKHDMKEHPGGFFISDGNGSILIAGDGRLLDGSDRNLWIDYMSGATEDAIVDELRAILRKRRN